ncbi:MAG: hypothetical protein HQ581_24830 [Planctomycetes bacterium]|nr:hypothetical protein [Planctomycetota bacterium]
MKRRTIWTTVGRAATVAGCWLATTAAAWAQAKDTAEEGTNAVGVGLYAVCYGVVLLCIGLGVMVVLHSSKRRDRAKPEQFEEKKLYGK